MSPQRRRFVVESRASKKKHTFITERSKTAKYLCNLCSAQHKFNNEMNSRQLTHSLVYGQLHHNFWVFVPYFSSSVSENMNGTTQVKSFLLFVALCVHLQSRALCSMPLCVAHKAATSSPSPVRTRPRTTAA